MTNKSISSVFQLTQGTLSELMRNIGLQVPACSARPPDRPAIVVGADCMNEASGVRQSLPPPAMPVPAPGSWVQALNRARARL